MKNKFSIKIGVRNSFIIANGMYKNIRNSLPDKRIVAIHDINDSIRFRDKMHWLRETYDILSLGDLLETSIGNKTQIAITFDDGYLSWRDNVIPVLVDLNIPATFFICSGFVGLDEIDARKFAVNCFRRKQKLLPLQAEHIRSISDHKLFEIGGHTAHHLDLGKEYPTEILIDEIIRDRELLEDWTGDDVRWFAYPFGGRINVCNQTKEFVRNTGYSAAFTIIPRSANEIEDFYEIGRDSLDIYASDLLWRNWLNGGYDMIKKTRIS
ncbi:MAG: polysaccharide deacetylase family protein [Gammaproteobacteria bacterium]|nr:polysaccharide deacetylase family protein [Gammaproteobacteria bacterium]